MVSSVRESAHVNGMYRNVCAVLNIYLQTNIIKMFFLVDSLVINRFVSIVVTHITMMIIDHADTLPTESTEKCHVFTMKSQVRMKLLKKSPPGAALKFRSSLPSEWRK